MPQKEVWEKEYQAGQLVTGGEEPQKDVLRFLRFLKKEQGIDLAGLKVLDLGCGTGRNANHLASLGCEVTGLEIAANALRLAKERARDLGVEATYLHGSMGEAFSFADGSFDLVLDITSSNSLNQAEREVYFKETQRVLKKNGWFFVKALNKEGDKNAKNLLKTSPGPEPDTYIMKDLGLVERVFDQKSFRGLYGQYFKIIFLEKKTSYTRFGGQSYKRNFWLAYMQPLN